MEDQIFRTMDDSIKVVKDSWSKDITAIRSLLHELVENLSTNKPTPVEFRQFCGEDPELWISQAERYFEFYGTSENNKLLRASFYLDGEALEWFRWLFRNKQLSDWEHFVAKVRIRFGKQHLESPEGHVATIKDYSTGIDAQVFDKMSHGCCCSKVFATERSEVKVVTNALESDLKDATTEEVQVFDESSHSNSDTLQSHSETLQTELTTEVLVNRIGISTNSVPMTSLVSLNGYNCNVTKEEENASDNAAQVFEISPLRDETGYQISLTSQGSIMSNSIGRFTGIKFPFASATQIILGHHHDSDLHICNWVDTGQEQSFTGLLSSVSRETAMEQKVQGALEAFADGYSKQLRFRVIAHYHNTCEKLGSMPRLIQNREKHEIFTGRTDLTLLAHAQYPGEPHLFHGIVYFDYMGGDYKPQFQLGSLFERKETRTAFLNLVLEGLPDGKHYTVSSFDILPALAEGRGNGPSRYLVEDIASIWHCDELLIVPSNGRGCTYDSVTPLSCANSFGFSLSVSDVGLAIEDAHTLFEDLRKRGCLFAKLYDGQPVGGVEMGVECSCNFRNSCTSYKLLGESIAHSFLYSIDGAPTYLEEQYMRTQWRYFRSGMMWYHYEIAYLIIVMQWLLMELIRYEEDAARDRCIDLVYNILVPIRRCIGVANSAVLKLHQPSNILALYTNKERWKSKVQANFLKHEKGLQFLNLMGESKFEHRNAQYVIIVDMLDRSSQFVHAGKYMSEAAEFKDLDLLDVGLNMKLFRGLDRVGFQIIINFFEAELVVYLMFSNLPFDLGIHDIPITYVINLNMFTNSSVFSSYDPIATLWGDWVYSEGKSALCVGFILAMCKDAGLFGQVITTQHFHLYPYDPGIRVLLPNAYVPICSKGAIANFLVGGGCTNAGVMNQYFKLAADALLVTLRYGIWYKVEDPFDWVDLISFLDNYIGADLPISTSLLLMAVDHYHRYVIMTQNGCEEIALYCLLSVDNVKQILPQFLLHSNLEDKVLFEAGGIVVNSVGDSVEGIFGNLNNYVWDPG